MVRAITRPSPRLYPYIILGIALVTAASGMSAVRFAQNAGVPTPAIIAMRLMIATTLLTPFAIGRHSPTVRRLTRRDWLLLALAGLLFTSDITLFSEAMRHTSILLATVIGGLLPLWTALMERLILKAPLRRSVYIGLVLALTGGVIIALASSGNSGLGSNPLLGAALALGSGLSAALYLIVARSLRTHITLIPYIWAVFGFAAVVAITATVATGASLGGHTTEGYLWVLVATLVAQLISHPALNFSLGYLSPTFVSIAIQAIIVIAAIFAFFLFDEVPGMGEVIGSAVILSGIIFAINGQSRDPS